MSAGARYDARDELADELADALEEMVDVTCASMLGLWLKSTERLRRELVPDGRSSTPALPLGYASWGKSSRSKLEALAAFRHAVVWRLGREAWCADTAMGRIYFTPCPDVRPFTNAASDHRTEHGRAVLRAAREDCRAALVALEHAATEDESREPLAIADLRSRFVRNGARPTIEHVLKLHEHDDQSDRGPR